MRMCPKCAKSVGPGVKFCPACRADLRNISSEGASPTAPSSPGMSTCPKCGATVGKGSFCGKCGHRLASEASQKMAASEPLGPGKIRCVQCGKAIRDSATFCVACGASQGKSPLPQSASSSEGRRLCVACGASLPAASKCCTKCGSRDPFGLLRPSQAPKPGNSADKSEERQACEGCGKMLPKAASFCTSCGKKEPFVLVSAALPADNIPTKQLDAAVSKPCVECGKVLPESSTFCTSCGRKNPFVLEPKPEPSWGAWKPSPVPDELSASRAVDSRIDEALQATTSPSEKPKVAKKKRRDLFGDTSADEPVKTTTARSSIRPPSAQTAPRAEAHIMANEPAAMPDVSNPFNGEMEKCLKCGGMSAMYALHCTHCGQVKPSVESNFGLKEWVPEGAYQTARTGALPMKVLAARPLTDMPVFPMLNWNSSLIMVGRSGSVEVLKPGSCAPLCTGRVQLSGPQQVSAVLLSGLVVVASSKNVGTWDLASAFLKRKVKVERAQNLPLPGQVCRTFLATDGKRWLGVPVCSSDGKCWVLVYEYVNGKNLRLRYKWGPFVEGNSPYLYVWCSGLSLFAGLANGHLRCLRLDTLSEYQDPSVGSIVLDSYQRQVSQGDLVLIATRVGMLSQLVRLRYDNSVLIDSLLPSAGGVTGVAHGGGQLYVVARDSNGDCIYSIGKGGKNRTALAGASFGDPAITADGAFVLQQNGRVHAICSYGTFGKNLGECTGIGDVAATPAAISPAVVGDTLFVVNNRGILFACGRA